MGEPFFLERELGADSAGAPDHVQRVDDLIRQRLAAQRDPDEAHVSFAAHAEPRPELSLWRCPVCGAEEELGLQPGQVLRCDACRAAWLNERGGLTLEEPGERRGEHHSLAGWARLASELEVEPPDEGAPVIPAQEADLLQEAYGVALAPLQAMGPGEAELFPGYLIWKGAAAEFEQIISMDDMRTVTTERNNTLQIGLSDGRMMQLVFPHSSPLRWQTHLLRLRVTGEKR